MAYTRLRQPSSLALILALLAGTYELVRAQAARPQDVAATSPRLAPTDHPSLPGDPALYLFVPGAAGNASKPAAGGTASERLVRGVELIEQGNFSAALPLVGDPSLASTPLFAYSKYYAALALQKLNRLDEADAILIAASAGAPLGYLDEAIPLLRADIALARQDPTTAVAVLESITPSRATEPSAVLARLGLAAERAGEPDKAVRAYRRIYFEYPLSAESKAAAGAIRRLQAGRPEPPALLALELERAEALFVARRWSDARDAFEAIARRATRGDDRELAGLRMAECDVYLKRSRQAREALKPHLEGTRKVEARYFDLLVTKTIGTGPAYVAQARQFIREFPDSAWTEEVLDALATHFIVTDDDGAADQVFRDLLVRFPRSRRAERAGWKVGWASYRAGKFADAARVFDVAAASAPRADFRPSWLYWSGRAYEQLADARNASLRYRLTATDYLNSYYGRLASRRLAERKEARVVPSVTVEAMPTPLIPTSLLVRQLVGLGLYDDALRELAYAERAWGTSSAIEATAAWIRHHRAGQFVSMERFQNLRGAINQMKRAYPQYLAAGGEALPPEVLKIIFPLDYWPLIKAHADDRGLDPYLMAALVAQESTFTADIRSSANAFGLMQLIPSTGRRYALKVGLRGYSTASLTRPETNVRLGMTYFKDLMNRFGGEHLALASYNAGENRVSKWVAERPGIPQDEFIDDIPFPETQNYVKRILGTAEDYRRLYGGGILVPGLDLASRPAPAAPTVAPKRATTAKAPVRKPATSRTTRSTRAR